MIEVTTADGIATIHLDDGKRNAMNFDWFAALNDALDGVEADDDAKVALVAGREGTFSAGLDLKLLPTLDGEGLKDLIGQFARTMLRVFLFPKPTVAAATGHALGGGTILSMACDHAVAEDGEYRWGLNELAIGMPVPGWILAIARSNVSPVDLDRLVLAGAVVAPTEAARVGFADDLAPAGQAVERAREAAAARLALATPAYGMTKGFLRRAAAQAELDSLDTNLKSLFGG